MLKNILQIEAKVGEAVSHWLIPHGTGVDIAEQMCLQFLHYLGKLKEQAQAQADAQKQAESQVSEPKKEEVENVPS